MAFSNIGLKGLRGTLEAALESDDLSPLIKLVCSTGARQSTELDDSGTRSASPPAVRREEDLPIADGTVKAVVHALHAVSERRDMELKRTSQVNVSEMAAALRELTGVQSTAVELRRRAQEVAGSMQRQGAHFSSRMDSLNEALLVRERVQTTRVAITVATHIISLCEEAGQSIEKGQFYHARRVLTAMKSRYGAALKAGASDLNVSRHITAPSAQLGALSRSLLARINELEFSLESKLSAGLNSWLTQARAVAGAVGRRSMKLVEMEMGRSEVLAAQRAEVLKALNANKPTAPLLGATQVNKAFSFGADNTNNNNDHNSNNEILSVDPLDIADLNGGMDSNAKRLDMSLLLRCAHVHAADSSMPQLLEAYVEARQAQLGADLAPPGNLLVCHRAFLWQIVGSFVIEARVAALVPQLGSAAHADASWEGASAALAAEVGAAIDEATRSEDIRELKSQALLACEAIDRCCGSLFPTRGIRSTLVKRVERHRATMTGGIFSALDGARSDPKAMKAVISRVENECHEYLSGLVDPHELPAAVFGECDQVLAAAIASRVAAFVALAGDDYVMGESDDSEEESWDSEEDDEESDDKSDVYSDGGGTVGGTVGGTAGRSESFRSGSFKDEGDVTEGDEDVGGESKSEDDASKEFIELLELVSTAAMAEKALLELGKKLLGDVAPQPATGSASPSACTSNGGGGEHGGVVSAQLTGALMATENAAGRRIASGAEPAVDALADLDWAPMIMPRTAGALTSQCNEIMEVMRAGLTAVRAAGTPATCQERIMCAAIQRTGEDIMRLLASDEVPVINVFGAQRLLSDLEVLSRFAREIGGTPASLWLAEPRLLCEAIAFNAAPELLKPKARGGKYSVLVSGRAATIFDKVKDPLGPKSGAGRMFMGRDEAKQVAAALRKALTEENSTS